MTNQEALNIMCERCSVHDVCQGTGCTPRAMLQELVDRATPKKPYGTNGDWANLSMNRCPYCKAYPLSPNDDYCPNCGQAIDWSEED